MSGTESFTYDSMGNATAYSGATLSWEGKQLTGYSGSSNTVSYAYDENGLRTQKTYNGTTTNYYYNGSILMGMVTGSGRTVVEYTYDTWGKLL